MGLSLTGLWKASPRGDGATFLRQGLRSTLSLIRLSDGHVQVVLTTETPHGTELHLRSYETPD